MLRRSVADPTTPPATTGPSATPAGSPAASPTAETGTIAHPVGAAELVLRFDEGGGFVMPTFAMIQVPYFSLYGDGTVLYRPASAPWPEQKPGEPMRFPPLQVATMTEDQVQALLRDALGGGGLGVARESYENNQVADAPTAVFTVNADGRQRRVSVYALGMAIDDPANPNPDAAILGAMSAFAERLRNFDQEVAKGNGTAAGLYAPTRFRASILEGGPGGDGLPRPWPWPTFGPEGFTDVDPGDRVRLPVAGDQRPRDVAPGDREPGGRRLRHLPAWRRTARSTAWGSGRSCPTSSAERAAPRRRRAARDRGPAYGAAPP